MSIRAEKVSSEIKKVLAQPINNFAKEHNAGLVTITSVRISPDLQNAKVYVSILGDNISHAKFITILEDKKGYFRTIIGKNLRLRYTPDIKFFLDDTLEEMEHIQKLINDVRKDAKEVKINPEDYNESVFNE